jgi:hypothetical protein
MGEWGWREWTPAERGWEEGVAEAGTGGGGGNEGEGSGCELLSERVGMRMEERRRAGMGGGEEETETAPEEGVEEESEQLSRGARSFSSQASSFTWEPVPKTVKASLTTLNASLTDPLSLSLSLVLSLRRSTSPTAWVPSFSSSSTSSSSSSSSSSLICRGSLTVVMLTPCECRPAAREALRAAGEASSRVTEEEVEEGEEGEVQSSSEEEIESLGSQKLKESRWAIGGRKEGTVEGRGQTSTRVETVERSVGWATLDGGEEKDTRAWLEGTKGPVAVGDWLSVW